MHPCTRGKPFFGGLDTLPQGGGVCLPFLKFWVPSAESPLPPPGEGRPRVGWDFLGKIFVTKIHFAPEQWVARSGQCPSGTTLHLHPRGLGSNLGR